MADDPKPQVPVTYDYLGLPSALWTTIIQAVSTTIITIVLGWLSIRNHTATIDAGTKAETAAAAAKAAVEEAKAAIAETKSTVEETNQAVKAVPEQVAEKVAPK